MLGLVLRPINLTIFQVAQVNLADWRLLVDQSVFGVGTPMVGGAYDQTVTKSLFAGRCEKAVYVTLLQPVVGCVQLALNGVDFARVSLRH
ncbi:hypothetical protein D3C71_1835910 [compost metagenome]